MEYKNLTKAEKLKLYKLAKEEYAKGTPILEDFEFDALQEELGYENKDKTPTRKNPKYTVKHPLIMGSLSKVQIKADKNGNIDWATFLKEIKRFINKNHDNAKLIITPKFDGCSFEIVTDNEGNIASISGRGDNKFGSDYYNQLIGKATDAITNIKDKRNLCLRGEILISKTIFNSKYSVEVDPENGFANPRSWVAGLLYRDYENTPTYNAMLNDMSMVIYDIRKYNGSEWVETDWTDYIGEIPSHFLPEVFSDEFMLNTPEDLEFIYNKYNNYRIKKCEFALDGIVVKPQVAYRENNNTDYRPKDCVAIKFIPQLQETEIVDISWKLSEKTGELIPTIVTKPVIMDGKTITRASASNYGRLLNDKISIGTKVIISLAGDIIPFIYKVTDTTSFNENNLNIPTEYETYIEEGGIGKSGEVKRLKVILSEADRTRNNFITSVKNLNIPNLGPALAIELYNYLVDKSSASATNDFFDIKEVPVPDNILLVSPEDIALGIGGKNGEKIRKEFINVLHLLTLKDIIMTCNFTGCGSKIAEQCANYLVGNEYDFAHLSEKSYNWVFDKTSDNYMKVLNIVNSFGKQFTDFVVIETEEEKAFKAEQIPVILTGEPNDYASKGEFLKLHPEYRMTGSWKEVKIVFTNSLDSNTGKMKKAREKGIEIRVY